MKRLCLILAFLFLFTQTSSALLLPTPQVVYRGTVTGLRISAVDGTAFIDNLPYTYSSDFSAGVDGWIATRATAAGNIDGIGGEDNTFRATVDTSSNSHYAARLNSFIVGKKYTVIFRYYIPSGQSNVDSIYLSSDAWGGSLTVLSVLDTWTTVTKTFTANSPSLWVYAADGGVTTFTDAGGDDVFYIKDVTISEITPYMDGNHSIEIYDSSNRMLKGVLKAAGTSETISETESVTNGNMETGDPPSNWSSAAAYITDGVADERTGGAGSQSLSVTTIGDYQRSTQTCLTSGKLYSYNLWAKKVSGELAHIKFGDGTDITSSSTSWVNFTGYKTATSGNLGLGTISTGEARFDDVSFKQVLTPSSTGATIVSAKGGDVYNFSYKNASFTYNAASYYVIIRAIR